MPAGGPARERGKAREAAAEGARRTLAVAPDAEEQRMQTQSGVREDTTALLAESRVLSVFVYVDDLAGSRAFYESTLGLRELDSGDDSTATYDAGQVLLTLVPAAAHGVALATPTDDSTDIVFLVDDVAAMVPVMERRGVEFRRQRTYGVGTVVDFYDPNGHRLMMYEPSRHALETPAGDKMRPLWRTRGAGGSALIGPPAVETTDPDELYDRGLDGKPLLYVFDFVKDVPTSVGFYEGLLGMRSIHRTPCCNDDCPDGFEDVIKYDGGGLMLSTHHMHGHEAVLDDHGKPYGARDFEPEDAKGVAPLFQVPELDAAVERLREAGAEVLPVIDTPEFGRVARVDAPSGHLVYLYEPSERAWEMPAGERMRELARFG
jgi:catechol 2,3-dioxygenase-like lactoylglutathione lyase family enzyme